MKNILALVGVVLLSACGQPSTPTSTEAAATQEQVAVNGAPSPPTNEHNCSAGQVWSDELTGCYSSFELKEKLAEREQQAESERVRASNLAAFKTAMTENSDEAVAEMIKKIPDDLQPPQGSYFHSSITEGGRPDASLIQSWAKTVFGDWAYWPVMQIEELGLLRTYFQDFDHVVALEDMVTPRLQYITLDASMRKAFEEGKPLFEKPLALLPTDGGWYQSIVEADTLPPAPDFWIQAYGAESFTKSAVWWFMFLHRRQKEGGPDVVDAWQHNLTVWLAEIAKRPNVQVPTSSNGP